jgi:raffinose/stachyose/melibiose transport system permease protein
MSDGDFFLKEIVWDNLLQAWQRSSMDIALTNSIIITVGSVILIVLLSAGAGYVFARVNTWYNKVFFSCILFSMFIPGIINTVPLYSLMKFIGGINTHWGMICLITTSALPFSTFLYMNFIKQLPREIEESAIIDGCTKFGAFWRISFPLMLPITSAVIIINFIGAWNNYAQAVFFLQRQDMHTIPLAISRFVQSYGADYTLMGSSALIGLIPVTIVYLMFQRYFVSGLSVGAVKG